MKLISVPYTPNITPIFNSIARFPWSIWLDSGSIPKFKQSYDIITCFPYKTISSNIRNTIVKSFIYNDNLTSISSSFNRYSHKYTNPFEILHNIFSDLRNTNANDTHSAIPFWHGVAGYFGYDLNQLLYKQLKKQAYNSEIPVLALGVYAWALIYDHDQQKAFIAYEPNKIPLKTINNILELFSDCDRKITLLRDNKEKIKYLSDYFKINNFKPTKSSKEYDLAYSNIKHHISNGDCYQINYAIPFQTKMPEQQTTSWQIYQYLKMYNGNPFGCYFNINHNLSLLSFSPERFIEVKNNIVKTQPIKGTRPNHPKNDELNNRYIQDLLTNPKDRAENIMITDLLRNDLNKFSIPGSVKTAQICELQTFQTVHHLVSTIESHLDPKYNSIDLLKGIFPGGSITGAPKIRAMQIIQELENQHHSITRYAYCGCIGYININYTMDLNIAIRTSIQHKKNLYYWAGGGIVADSENRDEYQEVFSKLLKLYDNSEHQSE